MLSRDRKWKMKVAGPCETIWVCNLELSTDGLLPSQQSPGGRGPIFRCCLEQTISSFCSLEFSRAGTLRGARVHTGFPGGSGGKVCVCNAGDLCLTPASGRSPRDGNGYPVQYSCLDNPMEKGAWQAIVDGVTNSQTRLSTQYTHRVLLGVQPWALRNYVDIFKCFVGQGSGLVEKRTWVTWLEFG